MKRVSFNTWAMLIAFCAIQSSRSVRAQNEGYQLNRLAPAPAGDLFTLVENPQFSTEHWLSTRLTFDYSKDSIAVDGRDGNGDLLPAPIGHSQYARLAISGNLSGRLGLSLELPFVLYERGTEFFGVGPSGAAVSDPRVGVRTLLFCTPTGSLSVSGSLDAWIPIGTADDLAGDDGLRLLPKLILGGSALGQSVRWAFNAGYLYREAAYLSSQLSPIGNTVGSEVRLAAGASYTIADGKLSLGPELTVALAVDNAIPSEQSLEIVELFATARYALSNEFELGLGVGTGLIGSQGAPAARALFTLSYSPRRWRVASSYEMVVLIPDEDGHIGALEVDDGKTKTVLDTAYASTELSKKDKVARFVQSSAQALEVRAGALAKVMPPVDRDSDGVADSEDSCPDRVGEANADALRNGCPASLEKVVVLPDEDGNVGAIEIDDGNSIVLVDKAYATAEVGGDGKVHAVAPASAKAVERAIRVMAKVLPPADADADTIRDRDDACPDRKGVASPDPLRNGCPQSSERVVVLPDADGHVGALEIDNGKAIIVIDKAYASAEVADDGSAVASAPSKSPQVIDKAIAAIAATLPRADGDGDGVYDEDDACPHRKGLASNNKRRNGCPEASEVVVILPDENGHVGSLEIDDGKTKVVLDKAFASAEVGSNGRAVSVPSASPAIVMRNFKEISEAMPKADADADGIVDAYDACPQRKGISRADSLRHGCPAAAETIVLLPDEDGHIGAIEIGDGENKIVIDKAFATAEIGADGQALTVEAAKHEVHAAFAEIIATAKAAKNQLPKSAGRVQFVVYFDEQAVPTRDVDEQIRVLMQELQKRDDYSIEVVGHTDGTGSNGANLRVGLARASAIAKRLQGQGVSGMRVGASTRGSSEPAVEVVNPGTVPEPLNRRVEIRIKEPGQPQLTIPFVKGTRAARNMRGEYRALSKRLAGVQGLKVLVVGHSDATENSPKLGLQRAKGVARQLRAAGISRNVIEVVSRDAKPAVVDSAGKSEPNKRRVEIFLSN